MYASFHKIMIMKWNYCSEWCKLSKCSWENRYWPQILTPNRYAIALATCEQSWAVFMDFEHGYTPSAKFDQTALNKPAIRFSYSLTEHVCNNDHAIRNSTFVAVKVRKQLQIHRHLYWWLITCLIKSIVSMICSIYSDCDML